MSRSLLVLIALCGLATGCVKYDIHTPSGSGVRYGGKPDARQVALADARPGGSAFSHGRTSIKLRFDGAANELEYLQRGVASELALRGIAPDGAGRDTVRGDVRAFSVRNRRVSGFSPMVTFTRLSIDFTDGSRTVRVAGYSKQTKTPVWSMGELEGPCFNRPLQVMVGEVAAKVNRHFVGARSRDGDVENLTARAGSATGEALLQIANELGWSNHPAALTPLLRLMSHESEEVRGAALGAIGTLGLAGSFDALRGVYEAPRSHTDRYMALKAIGDLGTPPALAYLEQVARAPGDDDDDILEITALYLDGRPVPAGPQQVVARAR